ncbi:MAG: hypothetical protein Q8928_00455 [Bacteroidota bacterium]|nr:hypothetical protein [Bacteroidota bacterium]
MQVKLDDLIHGLCREAHLANANFILAQRSAFKDLLKDEYHEFYLSDNNFLGIGELKFTLYLVPRKASWWKKLWFSILQQKVSDEWHYTLAKPANPKAICCELTIKREGDKYVEEVKLNDPKKDAHVTQI